MATNDNRPIIVKRRKVVAGTHHGGAWKVAYADFVTAMMAFFLLMWLLGATTEEQRKGIADYFTPTVPVKRLSGGGDDSFGGDNVLSEERLAKSGVGGAMRYHASHDRAVGATGLDVSEEGEGEGLDQDMEEVRDRLLARSGESMISDELRQHMLMRMTDEGLVVELFDLPGRPLFLDDGKESEALRALVRAVGTAFTYSSNQVAIKGFVRSLPLVVAEPRRFETSLDRAERVRKLVSGRIPPARVQRVTGYGDRKPAVAANTTVTRNNRIELVLLR